MRFRQAGIRDDGLPEGLFGAGKIARGEERVAFFDLRRGLGFRAAGRRQDVSGGAGLTRTADSDGTQDDHTQDAHWDLP
jgi:hypothetical protein